MITPSKIAELVQFYSLRGINKLLDPVERLVAPRRDEFKLPPIFIVGAPRSGSTILYQVLVNALSFGYLTNLHCLFSGFPYIFQVLIGRWLPEAQSPYTSRRGHTDGLLSPSECGGFWYRWFRLRPQYIPIEDVDMNKLQSLRRVLIGLTNVFGQPLLFKNMHCTLRLRPLSILLPEARFIFVLRNPLWMAQSLLLVRKKVQEDEQIWWSMEPPDIDRLRHLPPEEQVVRQIDSIHRLVQQERERIAQDRFLEVRYEDLCADVHGTLERVQLFLSRSGVEVNHRFDVPDTFPVSQKVRLAEKKFEKLERLVKDIRPYGWNI